jgi:putative transposase
MKEGQSQTHAKWTCKYHAVILPKRRRKVLYQSKRRGIGQIQRDRCRQNNIELLRGKAMPDHFHMLLSVPPRYSIAMTIACLRGKSAARILREPLHAKGTLFGRSFQARGCCVSTVRPDEGQIRRYIRDHGVRPSFNDFVPEKIQKLEPSREGAPGGLERASGFPFPL